MKKLIDSTVLLGFTRENNIVFGNVEVKEREGINSFSMSFDIVSPLVVTDEIKNQALENIVDNMTESEKFHVLEMYDERPSKLIECINDGYEDLFDISLYSEIMVVDNESVIFESVSCGQCGNDNDMVHYFTSEKNYNYLIELWKNNHLKEITDIEIGKLHSVIGEYNEIEIDDAIQDFVNEIFSELD